MLISADATDLELFLLSRDGDEDAFVALYRRRYQAVFRFVAQLTGDESVAEDVTQEVFVLLARGAIDFDPARGALQALLYGVARNLVRRRQGRERGHVPIDADDGTGMVPEALVDRTDVLGELARSQTVAMVRQAVGSLPAHYREVVILCDLHEQSYEEAAAALGCAVGTVRSRLHRARGLLLDKLQSGEAPARLGVPHASGGILV
jgi:RNA polymerase sigma-70 factor (ECF subfamily)